MSVAEVHEVFEDEGELVFSFTPEDTSARCFRVRCTSRTDGPAVLAASGLLPLPGMSHPTLPHIARKAKAKRIDKSPYHWWWNVDYSDAPIKEPQDPNPLNRPAVITGNARQYSRHTLIDRDQNAIINAAGDLFDPIEMDDARWTIKVKKNIPYNAVPSIPNDVINQDPFSISQIGLSVDQETLKISEQEIDDLKTELVVIAGVFSAITYRAYGFSLAYREEGWAYKTPQRGFRALNVGSNPLVSITVGMLYYIKILDANNLAVLAHKPQYLNDDGSELFPAPTAVNPDLIVYKQVNLYTDYDFSTLTPYCS